MNVVASCERLLAGTKDPLRLSPLFHAQSGQVLEAVRKLGLEGVVGKRLGSIYEPGERSGAWIKHRANMEQEFVIGGYIPGAHGFDALLVGVYEKKRLIFAGKVKNGISARYKLADAAQCHRELEALPAIHCRRESHKLMSCFRSKKCDTNFRNGSET